MEAYHDFVKFPELTNPQLIEFYFQSPHKQVLESFSAKVVKIHDGDTLTLRWDARDFDFPVRFATIGSKEINEGGEEARDFLRGLVLGHVVDIIIDPSNRVEKWGRLLGRPMLNGMDLGEMMIQAGHAVPFSEIHLGAIRGNLPGVEKWLSI